MEDTAKMTAAPAEAKKSSGLSVALFALVVLTLALIAGTVYAHEAVRLVEYVWSVT